MNNTITNFQITDTIEIIKYLPRYLRTKKGYIYILNFIKHEREYSDDAYIARYSKLNNSSISTVKYILEVKGETFQDVIFKIYNEYNILILENKTIGSNLTDMYI